MQGVVSSNDGNAGAAVAALEEQGLAGRTPVSGLDCTVEALQLMLLGKQTQSVWRDFNLMMEATAKAVVALVNDESLSGIVVGVLARQFRRQRSADGAGRLLQRCRRKGVQYVIDNDSSISKADVCKGEAAQTAFCRG